MLPEKLDGQKNIGQILGSPFLRHGKDNDLFLTMQVFIFLFPKILARHLAVVYIHRLLIADTHMGPNVVVEVYHRRDFSQGLCVVAEHSLMVEPLVLEDTVHTLCYGVVRGIVTLGHADAYMMLHEDSDVLLAGILHATVGMMDGTAEISASSRPDGDDSKLPSFWTVALII